MTVILLSRVRVKRKGQVTIPQEIRSKLGIEEGSIIDITIEDGASRSQTCPKVGSWRTRR